MKNSTTKKTILFVDDEPNILAGLRRMLRSMRRDWEMHFVESGQEALALMEERPVDVIVSDMRMPGLSGYQVLQAVRERFPYTIRIMLTGQPDRETYCDVIAISHFFLWKPAKFDQLKALFDTILDIDCGLQDQQLQQLIGSLSSLPSPPFLYLRLSELLQDQEVSSKEVADIVNEDIAMPAQILKMVNSAFFGMGRTIETIQEAISYLGIDLLRHLVLVEHLFSQWTEKEMKELYLNDLYCHSLCTGRLAMEICKNDPRTAPFATTAYLAGLVHDIGKLVLARHFPEKYRELYSDVHDEKDRSQRERELFQKDHAVIGGYLTSLWGLPYPITEAVFHHASELSDSRLTYSPVLEAVWHANRICHGDVSQSTKFQEVIDRWCYMIDSSASGSTEL